MSGEVSAALAELVMGRPRTASVCSVTASGAPLLTTAWFLVDEAGLSFHTRARPVVNAARSVHAGIAVVDDYAPPDHILRYKISGHLHIEDDPDVVRRLYQRYLGKDMAAWHPGWIDRLSDAAFSLIRVQGNASITSFGADLHSSGSDDVTWGNDAVVAAIRQHRAT